MSIPETVYGVSELTRELKYLLERDYASIWVRGEISNLSRHASGHHYFVLKDEGSQVPAVLFRGNARSLDGPLEAGQTVLCLGDLSVYEPHGRYQLIVRMVVDEGRGRLQQRFEALKRQLREEGLFELEGKRPLPRNPTRVGILTSGTGAALRDFISILRRRNWRGRLQVFPSIVQGAEAVPSLLRSLDWIRVHGGKLDVIVIGRGGGSMEDLWAFNEEALIRALFRFPIPVISAVGHETDFVLTDFVSDLRAETPSAAAELVSSSQLEARSQFEDLAERLLQRVDRRVDEAHQKLDLLSARLLGQSPERSLLQQRRNLDHWVGRLQEFMQRELRVRDRQLQALDQRLARHEPEQLLKLQRQRLEFLETRLKNAGIENTLKRGFVLIRDDQGKVISRAEKLELESSILAEFQDGKARLKVEDTG